MIEFQETSRYSELMEIASSRNSEMLNDIRLIAPSVHRVVKLRGRPPLGNDIDDVLYDFNDFAGGGGCTRNQMVRQLGAFSLVEATYYKLATNIAYNTAGVHGLNHRTDDLVDVAKDAVSRTVWNNWRPERGDDFINLHNRVCTALRYHLIHFWTRRYRGYSFSNTKDYILEKAEEINLTDSNSPEEKPIHRFRRATTFIPLPAIIARIDYDSSPIEKISALTLIGYYPDGRGFTGVASELGVKRETLSSALDRVIIKFRESKETFPTRPIKEIVDELIDGGVMKYPSGKNVEFDSPRLKLLKAKYCPRGHNTRESKILEMAVARNKSVFTYSLDEIAKASGCSFSQASKIINILANQPLDTNIYCA
jgi:hypothetical protein